MRMDVLQDSESAKTVKYLIEFWCLNHTSAVSDVPTKKAEQLCKKIELILSTIASISNKSLGVCLKTLQSVISNFDSLFVKLAGEGIVNSLSLVRLQANVNHVFGTLVTEWIKGIEDDKEKQDAIYLYLSDIGGFEFFFQRLKNGSQESSKEAALDIKSSNS